MKEEFNKDMENLRRNPGNKKFLNQILKKRESHSSRLE
jgi:hypothetical protein